MTAKFKGELFERSGRADLYVSSEQQDMHFSSGATRAAGLYYSKTVDVRRCFSIICGPSLPNGIGAKGASEMAQFSISRVDQEIMICDSLTLVPVISLHSRSTQNTLRSFGC